jgi:hypothetical protein
MWSASVCDRHGCFSTEGKQSNNIDLAHAFRMEPFCPSGSMTRLQRALSGVLHQQDFRIAEPARPFGAVRNLLSWIFL